MVDGGGGYGLTILVEVVVCNICVFAHTVLHLQLASAQIYHVGVGCAVVVEVVVLVCGHAEGVVGGSEHGLAKEVLPGAIGLEGSQRHNDVVPQKVLRGHILLAKIGHFKAILHLVRCHFDGCAVGDVEAFVEGHVIRAVAYGVCLFGGFQHVYHAAGLSVAEEGGVACGGGLRDLVFDGEEVHTVFACCGVGLHDDAFLLVVHQGAAIGVGAAVGAVGHVRHLVFEGVFGQVAGHAHQVADVVALQLQHHAQVVAEVVARKAEAECLLGLVQAADDTSGQTHLGLIPHPHAVEGGAEGEVAVAVDADEAVAFELVTILDHLQGEGAAAGHTDLEVARGIGLQRVAGSPHHASVEHQVGIAHRHGAVSIEHTTRKAHTGDVVERQVCHLAVVFAQRHGGRPGRGIVVAEHCCLRSGHHHILCSLAVEQTVEEEGARLVGDDGKVRLSVCRELDGNAGAAGAVLVAHAAADAAVGRPPARGGAGRDRRCAVAGEVDRELIVILLVGFHIEIPIVLVEARQQGGVGAVGAMQAAAQGVAVHAARGGLPRQQDAAFLAALGGGKRAHRCGGVGVEVGTVDGHRLQVRRVHQVDQRVGLVYAHIVSVVGAYCRCHIGEMGIPVAVGIATNAVLGDDKLATVAVLDQFAHQHKAGGIVPDGFSNSGVAAQLIAHLVVEYILDRIDYRSIAQIKAITDAKIASV